jgi:hypothetical protein
MRSDFRQPPKQMTKKKLFPFSGATIHIHISTHHRSIKNAPSKSNRRPPGGRRDPRRRGSASRRSPTAACAPAPSPPGRPRIPPSAAGTNPRRSRPSPEMTGLSSSPPPPPRPTRGCCCCPRRRGALTRPRRSNSEPWLSLAPASTQARAFRGRLSLLPPPLLRALQSSAGVGLVRVSRERGAECGGAERSRTKGGGRRRRGREGAVRTAVELCLAAPRAGALYRGRGRGVSGKTHAVVRQNWDSRSGNRGTGRLHKRRVLQCARLDATFGLGGSNLTVTGGRDRTRRSSRPEG